MAFQMIGILLLLLSIYFFGYALKTKDKDGIIGSLLVFIAAIVLLFFFGILSQWMLRI